MIRRREFIPLLGGAAAWPLAARAQRADRVRRIGVLMGPDENEPAGSGFRFGSKAGVPSNRRLC